MRTARIKIVPEEGEAVYHCMTRVVNGERIIDEAAREILRKQLWLTAEYCGVHILTYAIMSNHFHVLVKIPQRASLSDAELLRRYKLLHPAPTRFQTARLEVIAAQLKDGGPDGQRWRRLQLQLMGDVSGFMRLVKQRFSTWFNKTHNRFGTLWSERFKSVLVEPGKNALQTIALYIDLNPVRAGLVQDPKDYRFCGYSEAVVGNNFARTGLQCIYGPNTNWRDTHDAYRTLLFGTGAAPRPGKTTISEQEFKKVLEQNGRLPLATVLRCRVRYFTDAAVLGSHAFVAKHLAQFKPQPGQYRDFAPHPLAPITDWGGLTTLHGLRKKVFG